MTELKFRYPSSDTMVWTVFSAEQWSDPAAIFSDEETAQILVDRLNTFISDGVLLGRAVLGERAIKDLVVDEYSKLIHMGLCPFCISLDRHGNLADPIDTLGLSLSEPTIYSLYDFVVNKDAENLLYTDKKWRTAGTFWAPNKDLALKRAMLFWEILIEVLSTSTDGEKASF